MKALTVSQPFAHLIANGPKRVENRAWPTSYRGPLLIHAGKGAQYRDDHDDMRLEWWPRAGIPPWDSIPKGAVVAVAELAACVPLAEYLRVRGRGPQREWAEGPWCWVLTRVAALPEPIPWKGALGLWDAPAELVRLVEAALDGSCAR